MKPAARYSVRVLMLVALLQALLIGGTYYHTSSLSVVDTYEAFNSLYVTHSKMAVYGTPVIAKQAANPQLIILGSSDGFLALRPKLLTELTGITVHNLSVEHQNIKSFSRMLDLLYQQTPREYWPNLHIVVAVSAVSFKNDARAGANRLTQIDREMLRHGVFREVEGKLAPSFGAQKVAPLLDAAHPFMLPFFVYSQAARAVFRGPGWYKRFESFFPGVWIVNVFEPWFPTDADSNSKVFTLANQEEYVGHINRTLGPAEDWNEGGLQQLEQMAARVSATGGHFFIVDLPTASWWKKKLYFHRYYEQHKSPYFARMKAMPHVHYIAMDGTLGDGAFFDGVHARASVRPEIARRVAGPINHALAEGR